MAKQSLQLLHVCTRCRIRSLIRDFRIARSPRLAFSARTYTVAAVREQDNYSARRPQLQLKTQHGQMQAFRTLSSPLLFQNSQTALRRRRRGDGVVEEIVSSPEDGNEETVDLPTERHLELLEFLYIHEQINKDEWRQAVFTHAGAKDTSDIAEDDKAADERVRKLRKVYEQDGSAPSDLLNEAEVKIWERLFGRDSLRPLQAFGLEEIQEANEEGESGTGILREGEDGLEEVEFDEDLEDSAKERYISGNERLADDIRGAMESSAEEEEDLVEDRDAEEEPGTKIHPLTKVNRFGTNPSTLQLSKSSIVDPISAMLAGVSSVHIAETANRVFGGVGLPYSTSTPQRGKLMQQKPIALDAYQSQMSPIEGDTYMVAMIPGIYASVLSVLAETRKRLGTTWAEELVRKAQEGNLRILDAGGGGAGVLAVRELLRAEWERMHEEDAALPMDLVQADGRAGGAALSPPLGSATVLTGSYALRSRASRLLENTTFIPRLPDYLHTEEAKTHGKFDIIIAPHTLWQLREDYLRKTHVQNLWSLLSSSGGVLILLEKGIPRGFEFIAGAREMLLDTRISAPGAATEAEVLQPLSGSNEILQEPGMIIAPCTNHTTCPLYQHKGVMKGRRDICSFAQRYHRPPFLQKLFGARGRNHEDVKFSYLSVMRGRDLREANSQGIEASERAFRGYENSSPSQSDHHVNSPARAQEQEPNDPPTASAPTPAPTASAAAPDPIPQPPSLSLPRMIFPPLKRKGHVILDVCTPAGTLERWTVPRSFSKVAFRDARKSAWGDLWALGAKTSIPRNLKVGVKEKEKKRKDVRTEYVDFLGSEEDGVGEEIESFAAIAGGTGGVGIKGLRRGKKIKGIRDKRDKKGMGNGRRKNRED